MIVGITGSSGFIGTALSRAIAARGWTAAALSRAPGVQDLQGCDAVVHLAGESVDGRWTGRKKAEIERSRVEGTRTLVNVIGQLERKPRVLVSASAAGYYGDRGDEPLFEHSAPGGDFLARVCTAWERETAAASGLGVRTVMLRTGIVLGRGGALSKMKTPFAFGVGGPLGNGRQFVPWIHLDDMVAMYVESIENESLRGPVNAVTPDYALSARVSQAIGSAMRRPSLAPAPAFALRAVLGEFAGTVLASQLVIPAKMQAAGFQWMHPHLEEALQSILNPARRVRSVHTFTSEQFVPAPLQTVFEFFSDAGNLEAITPPSLRFSMRSKPDSLAQGSVIEYRLKVHGIPISWKTMISAWDPPYRFADVQLHGPYALWEHEHTFTPAEGGVRIGDRVRFALPFAPFGSLAAPLVRKDIASIFAHRAKVIAARFSAGT